MFVNCLKEELKTLEEEAIIEEKNNTTNEYYACTTTKNGQYQEYITTEKYDSLMQKIDLLQKLISIY